MTAGTVAVLIAAAGGWFAFGPQGVLLSTAASASSGQGQGSTAARADTNALTGGHVEAPAANRSDRSAGNEQTFAQLPGLGADFRAKVPANSSQVLLVSGAGKNSPDSTATLWTRTSDGRWQPGTSWPAHNALKGWTDDHHLDDLRSPVGVYGLTDAGGLKPNPGTRLPYDRDASFTIGGKGFEGEDLAGSFDYVVAINYNRVAGTSPLDGTKPLGAVKGGGIWVHVDHGGPTHACISLAEGNVAELLRELNPAAHPVIVMGDRDSLAA